MSAKRSFPVGHERPGPREAVRILGRYLRARVTSILAAAGRKIPRARRLSRRQLLMWELVLGLPLLLVLLVALRVFIFVYLDPRGLPDIETMVAAPTLSIGSIEDARGEVLVELAQEYRKVVDYKDIPPVVQNAILAAEDKRFFSHGGVDFLALPRVLWKTATHFFHRGDGDPRLFAQGGSTITQQLARAYFLRHLTSREKSDELIHRSLLARATSVVLGTRATNKLIRKLEEIRVSVRLERAMRSRYGSRRAGKEQILARYASVVYLGRGRHGFEAASEYYFGKPISSYGDADAGKAALLAGLAKAPEFYAPTPGRTAPAVARRNDVLEMMVKRKFLDRATAERLKKEEPVLATHQAVKREAPSVVGAVFDELKSSATEGVGVQPLVEGRIQVRVTVDMRIQEIVEDALEKGLAGYEARHPRARGRLQGAVLVLRNSDGAILAETGGREVYESRRATYTDYNRATDAARQPGSAMKPLVYLAAFRRGIIDLDSSVPDLPISVTSGPHASAKWIANYDGKFKGMIPARQALAESRNAAAIWVAQHVGIGEVIRTAKELGITSPLEPWISTALGASDVRLIELANVYRAMASGVVATPHLVDVVKDAAGRPVTLPRRPEHVLDNVGPALSGIQEGLRGVVKLPGGTAHALDTPDFGIPVMGKTGTTNEFRDALFVGSTYGPDGITVAVRIGFDDFTPLGEKETGARTALPVFREIVQKAYAQGLVGRVPAFPEDIERRIEAYLETAARIPEEEPLLGAGDPTGVEGHELGLEPGSAPPPPSATPELGVRATPVVIGDPPTLKRPILGRITPTPTPTPAPVPESPATEPSRRAVPTPEPEATEPPPPEPTTPPGPTAPPE